MIAAKKPRISTILHVTRFWVGGVMLAIVLSGIPSSAHALCIYQDKLYAKTTLEQELQDSSLVVRGDVLSTQDISIHDTDESLGVLYRIKIDQSFKGKPPAVLTYYSRRDSGGFYLDVG